MAFIIFCSLPWCCLSSIFERFFAVCVFLCFILFYFNLLRAFRSVMRAHWLNKVDIASVQHVKYQWKITRHKKRNTQNSHKTHEILTDYFSHQFIRDFEWMVCNLKQLSVCFVPFGDKAATTAKIIAIIMVAMTMMIMLCSQTQRESNRSEPVRNGMRSNGTHTNHPTTLQGRQRHTSKPRAIDTLRSKRNEMK